jgi:hypothetical protein
MTIAIGRAALFILIALALGWALGFVNGVHAVLETKDEEKNDR